MSLDLNGGPATPPLEAPPEPDIQDPVAYYRSQWEAANRLLKKAEKENETLRTLAQRAKGAEMAQTPAEVEAAYQQIDWARSLTDEAYSEQIKPVIYKQCRLVTEAEDAARAAATAAAEAAKAAEVPRWSDGTPRDPFHDAEEVVARASVDQGFFEREYERVKRAKSYLARQAREQEEAEILNRRNERARSAGKGKA